MSRVEKIERRESALKEEKKLARIEDAFVAKKLAGTATMEDRLKLREARQDWRLNHRVSKSNAAQPETIGVSAEIEEV